MKKALILSSALVLGMSSVAMADSFSFGAKASVSWGTPASRVIVRDHRTPTYRTPTYQAPAYQAPITQPRYNNDLYGTTRPVLPAGVECRNWDPTVDVSDPCAQFFTNGHFSQVPYIRGWNLLGVRESSVADNQFLTVNDGRVFGRLKLRAETGSPIITKVAVRFMDNSVQVINLGGCLENATLQLSNRPINQIVVYTAANSRGTYSIAAL